MMNEQLINVNLTSIGLTMRQLCDVWQEALREIELTDIQRGAGNGKFVYVRVALLDDDPIWVKVYIYLVGNKFFVDAQPVSDEEVLKRGCAV